MMPRFSGKGFVQGVFLTITLMLFKADSITFSPVQIKSFFDSKQLYLYAAAHLGFPDANWLAYQKQQDKQYLLKAARGNHPAAVYFLYQTLKSREPYQASVWLEQSVNLGVEQAIVEQLSSYVAKQEWTKAESFIQRQASSGAVLSPELEEIYGQLKDLVSLARADALDNLTMYLAGSDTKFEDEFYQSSGHCRLTAQVLVANGELKRATEKLLSSFAESLLANVGVCFSDAALEPKLNSICASDEQGRIDCDLAKLAVMLKNELQPASQDEHFSHLLIVVSYGEANTRGGLMFLDGNDDLAVLQHEVAHWLGLVDEYRINPSQQAQLCTVDNIKWIGSNVLVAPKSLQRADIEAKLERRIYPTQTCSGSKSQAYKVFSEMSFMEFLDKAISKEYLSLLTQDNIEQYLIPAAMNLALAFRPEDSNVVSNDKLEQQLSIYEYWLTEASKHKFPPALRMLAQLKLKQGQYLQAERLLTLAADWHDPTAQLLLGHSYLEGTWLPRDLTLSAAWYRKAALSGDDYGLYFYGKCFEMGWGCIKSTQRAMDLYQQAAEQGNALAVKRLNRQHVSKRGSLSQ